MLLRHGAVASPQHAASVLAGFVRHPRHRFWADAIDYSVVSWSGLLGHRQVTDAYLAALARHQQGRLATLDRGQIGRASCRERVCPYVSISVVAGSLKTKKQHVIYNLQTIQHNTQ